MKKEKVIVGLDIGSTKIVVVAGKKNSHGKIDVTAYGRVKSSGVQNGTISNLPNCVAAIKEAIQQAEKSSPIVIKEVVVGVPSQNITSRQHTETRARKKVEQRIDDFEINSLSTNLDKLPTEPGTQIISIVSQDYLVDGQLSTSNPIGLCGSELTANYHIVSAKTSSLRNVGNCISETKLKLNGVTLESLASANATLSSEELDNGVVLVDIGGGTTDVAVYKDGFIRHIGIVQAGGIMITQDIRDEFGIHMSHAETLKLKVGSATPLAVKENQYVSIPSTGGRTPKKIHIKEIAEVINNRLTKIIKEVMHEIESCGVENPTKKLSEGILLTGGGSLLNHIVQVFNYQTGMSSKVGSPVHLLSGDDTYGVINPIHSTAIGLLHDALNNSELQGKRGRRKKNYSSRIEDKISQIVSQA